MAVSEETVSLIRIAERAIPVLVRERWVPPSPRFSFPILHFIDSAGVIAHLGATS